MTTITHSTGVITPLVVDGYEAGREARTVVHSILGRSNPDVTLRATSLRTGELVCVFGDRAAAFAAFAALVSPQVLTIEDPDVSEVGMSFVVAEGEVAIALDDALRSKWLVTVPFVEVTL